jgi:hypothetical protein
VFFHKAVDNGIYTLFDNKGKVLKRDEGSVLNKLIPDKDGRGDYITLNIEKTEKSLTGINRMTGHLRSFLNLIHETEYEK